MDPAAHPPILAADIMQRRVFALSPEWTLARAIHDLLRHGFSGAPVVDGAGRLVGVLSEKDCLEILASDAFHQAPSGLVADAMERDVVAIPPEHDIFKLTTMFQENPFRRLPVVDPTGRLIGMITRRDLLKALDTIRRRRENASPETTYDAIRKHREHPPPGPPR